MKKRAKTPPSKGKSPIEPGAMLQLFHNAGKPKTPEEKATYAARVRQAGRMVQKGAAMLGLVDAPDDSRAKRKLDPNTPGGTP